MIRDAWRGLLKPVFVPASLVILGMIVFAVVYAGSAEGAVDALNRAITTASAGGTS